MWLFIKGCGGRDQPVKKISRWIVSESMPRGLKPTSGQVVISGATNELAPNTFIEAEVDLALNVLDREVFVCTAADMNPAPPDGIAATDTYTASSMSTTSRTVAGNIGESNVVAVGKKYIRAGGFADAGVAFEEVSPETPQGDMDYIAIIATNNFYIQLIGNNNISTKTVYWRLFGYRAIADAGTFAALTQSELLSA